VHSRIVVGGDGSPVSIRALKWALDQAALTGAAVEAVNAWQYPQVLGGQASAMGVNFSATAEQIFQNAVESVGASTESVTTRTVLGHPVQVLVDASGVPISWLWVSAVTAASSECFSGPQRTGSNLCPMSDSDRSRRAVGT
jgi:Universal stress protein family